MGTPRQGIHNTNMGDPANDFGDTVKPYCIAGGIFDFSGTQEQTVYTWQNDGGDKGGSQPTKEEVALWTQFWWDGASDDWTSDTYLNEHRSEYKLVIGGIEFRFMRRIAFGENESQHAILARSKNSDWKTGCVIAHSDYTTIVGVYDEDAGQSVGNLQMAITQLSEAYKQQGF